MQALGFLELGVSTVLFLRAFVAIMHADRYLSSAAPRMSVVDDLARFTAFERRLAERLSTRVEPFEYGIAFLDEEYRERYNSNFLLPDKPLEGVPAAALLEAAERILGGSGYKHREVDMKDDHEAERLAPEFAEHGYNIERNAVMMHRQAPDRTSDLAVEELQFTGVASLLAELYRREPWATSEKTVRSFTEQHGKYERVIGARFFAVRVEGELAGKCELYTDGANAQVENVGTLEEYRGRGVARAVVLRAVEEARATEARHIFIVADEQDWPKDLYAKLGFERIGRTWQFIRWPEGERPG